MVTASGLRTNILPVLNMGTQVRIKIYGVTFGGTGSGYDDLPTLTQSGANIWTSGVKLPINPYASPDGQFLAQGKVLMDDCKIYILGNVDTSGAEVKVGLGSCPAAVGSLFREYRLLEEGTKKYELGANEGVFKVLYCRQLKTGSLVGE